jgi:hypothetical protein
MTGSQDFPTTNGSFDISHNGDFDGYIIKFNYNCSKLIFSTFLGGNGYDHIMEIALDLFGNFYFTGFTGSSNFPTSNNAYDNSYNGGVHDLFVCKFNQNCTTINYSTYIGGNDYDWGEEIIVDNENSVFITGATKSLNFPTTNGTYDSTYNGGNWDVFVLKLNQNGTKLVFSTFIGGNSFERGRGLFLDSGGNIFVAGFTSSSNFPFTSNALDSTHNGNSDVFITSLISNGSNITYSTIIGGVDVDICTNIAVDNFRNIFCAGYTLSSDFPTTNRSFDITHNGKRDCFVLKHSFNITNSPPVIKSFTATRTPEGSKVIFTVDSIDPDNDTLEYSFDFQNDDIIDLVTTNNTANYTWGDDYSGIALVRVSDGNLSAETNTSVIVYNVAPKIQVNVSLKNQTTESISANLSIRIAGEKWHDVKVELYKQGKEVANGSLIRYPGNPNEQMLHFKNHTIDSTSNWSAILCYTPENDKVNGKPNGATPCWVILNLNNSKQIKLHHTFKVKHKNTHVWKLNLSAELPVNSSNTSKTTTFYVNLFDPGADNITLYLDFGDGINITKFYPNNNQTFPVSINLTLFHNYTSSGSFSVIFIAKDDDGGVTTIKFSIDFG